MLKTFRIWAALVAMVMLPLVGRADEKKDGPSILVRMQSIDHLIKSVEYFAAFAGEDAGEQIKQGVSFIKSLIDEKKGLEGIDTKSPIGIYATLTPELLSSPIVALIPVADEETVIDALKNRLMLEIKKDKNGVYETTPPNSPMTVFFRFANKYAYITTNDPENIDLKKLPKPAEVLVGADSDMLAVTVRMDRLPEQMKKMALGALENQMAQAKEQPLPEETKAIKDFRDASVDQVMSTLKDVLMEGEAMSLRLKVDTKSEQVGLEIEMTGVKGSKLAKDIASIKENKSVVGGALSASNSIMSMNISASMASSLKKILGPVVDDVLKIAIEKANAPGEAQELLTPVINALKPTLKAGDLDAGMTVLGPTKEGQLTVLLGLKVNEGKKVEGSIRELVKKLPPDIAAMFSIDAAKLEGGAMLHTLKVPQDEPKITKLFGSSEIHLTFRDDLLLVAMGPEAKAALNKGLVSKPADVGIAQFQVALAKLMPIVAETANDAAMVKKVIEKVFKDGVKGNDTIKFSIEGGDKMVIKFMITGKAIQLLAEIGMATEKKDN